MNPMNILCYFTYFNNPLFVVWLWFVIIQLWDNWIGFIWFFNQIEIQFETRFLFLSQSQFPMPPWWVSIKITIKSINITNCRYSKLLVIEFKYSSFNNFCYVIVCTAVLQRCARLKYGHQYWDSSGYK